MNNFPYQAPPFGMPVQGGMQSFAQPTLHPGSGQGGSYPVPAAPPVQTQFFQHQTTSVEELKRELDAIKADIQAGLQTKLPQRILMPEQQKAGVIRYPDLKPYPFSWGEVELIEGPGITYATTGAECIGNITLNDIYSYIDSISFHLVRLTVGEEKTDVRTGSWLPISGHPSFTLVAGEQYQGKDFKWSAQSSTGYLWQRSLHSSAEIDPNTNKYVFPVEYNADPSDTIIVRAQPIEGPVTGETFRLFFMLHGYKMQLQPR